MGQTAFPLGAFELHERLGRGGMAEVWAGVHRRLGVAVAVKVVTTGHKRSESTYVHLRNEVRAMAQLDHPSIVMVFDYGEVSEEDEARSEGLLRAGSPWFAMELADEGTARPLCGRIPWSRTKRMLLSLLDALAHAHARGVLHRDVKPSNVLVFPGDVVKLSDFGLARQLEPNDEDHGRGGGTPAYMAPEQFVGAWREYDCATDLYAMGCLAYALVSGGPPYGSWNDVKLMARLHSRGVLPPLEPKIPVPDGFESWLRRMMHKNPGRRYQRAADAAVALRQLGDSEDVPMAEPSQPVPPTLVTLSDLDTVMTLSEVGDDGSQPPEDVSLDEFVSIHNEPLIAGGWQEPRRPSPPLVRAGLGLYGLRAIPLVARQDEREILWASLVDVFYERRPRVVLLEGPAGSGKSRLAQWLCERAHETGTGTVLKAVHSPRAGPGHGLTAMLTRYLRAQGLGRNELRAHLMAQLARHGVDDEAEVEALTELLAPASEAERAAGTRAVQLRSAAERHVLIGRFVETLAASRLVVLWLDDVQWGLGTLTFVQHLVATVTARVLVILTARSESLGEDSAERELLDAALKNWRASRLEIGPLHEDEWPALVEQLLRLRPELARDVARQTQGNPLFAVQLVGDWIDRDLLEPGPEGFALRPGTALALPAAIDELWWVRIEYFLASRVDDDAVALELAATLGQEIDGAEWRDACAVAGVSAEVALVEDLIARRLATTGPRGPTAGWAFVHGMLRESLERRSHDRDRATEHHRACAAMLRSRHGRGIAARLGRHLLAAGDVADSIEPLRDAARELYDTGDYVTAERLLGEREEAMKRIGLDESDARWGQGWLLGCRIHTTRAAYEPALELAERAEQAARENGWPRVLVEALLLRARVHRLCGETDLALEAVELAEQRARSLAERTLLAECRELHGRMLMHLGKLTDAVASLREAQALYDQAGQRAGAASVVLELGHAATYLGRYDEAAEHTRHALEELERLGDRWGVTRCLNSRGEILRLRGDLAGAERAYREAFALARAIGAADAISVCENNVARVQVERGRYREARETLERGVVRFEQSGRADALAWAQTVLLCCLAADGEWAVWERRLDNIRRLLAETGYLDLDIARSAQMAGDLALIAGQPARAREAYELALAQWQALGRSEDAVAVRTLIESLK
jgi:eukaryotic-like serine/threonine-protein kinase